ncbi:hypothetical protein ACOME3_010646, partial [Neoechinorhynchus agilis]
RLSVLLLVTQVSFVRLLKVIVFESCDEGKWYENAVDKSQTHVYVFEAAYQEVLYRATTEIVSSTKEPLLFSIQQSHGHESWSLPVDNKQRFKKLSRPLCPRIGGVDGSVRVEVSTVSISPIKYGFSLEAISMDIGSDGSFATLTPTHPAVYIVDTFNASTETLLEVTSNSNSSCYVSMQKYKCPVYDIEYIGQSRGVFQTMTTLSAFTIPPKSRLFIVLTMTATQSSGSAFEKRVFLRTDRRCFCDFFPKSKRRQSENEICSLNPKNCTVFSFQMSPFNSTHFWFIFRSKIQKYQITK